MFQCRQSLELSWAYWYRPAVRWLWSSGLIYDAPFPVGDHHLARRLLLRGESITWLSPHRPLIDRSGGFCRRALGYSHRDGLMEIVPATLLPARDRFLLNQPWLTRNWDRFAVPPLPLILRLHGANKPDVLWLSQGPNTRVLVDRYPAVKKVFRLSDLYSELPGYSPTVARGVHEALQRAQLILATSDAILDALPCELKKRAVRFPNGVDYTRFADFNGPRPAGFPERDAVVVFAGGIGPWVDLSAILRVAETTDATIALLGPSRQGTAIPNHPRICHVPHVRYESLPGWLASSRVGVVPFVDTPFTRAVSSNKVLQYLAAGLKVVCLNVPEAKRLGDAVVHAETRDRFVDAVQSALLAPSNSAELKAVAMGHDWDFRVNELMEALRTL